MMIEPLLQQTINGKEFVEISNFAAPGIKKHGYLISKDGDIYSLISNKFMNPTIASNGYKVINLKLENGSSEVFYLHRLMMITFNFVYNYEDLHVNHKDTDKTNDTFDNMEWTTLQENLIHAKNAGLLCTGEDCPWSKLTEKEVREICSKIQNGEYKTIGELAEYYNCSVTTIGDIVRGVTWKDISKDYDLNYNIRARFTDDQVHFMCRAFSQNKEKSFQYLYYLIIFYLGLPEDKFIRRRIYKIYKKDPNNFSYITSQYDY